MENEPDILGKLFKAKKFMAAVGTDPNNTGNKSITPEDYVSINPGDVLLLVNYHDLEVSGIWVWLKNDKIVWQIINKSNFSSHWRML